MTDQTSNDQITPDPDQAWKALSLVNDWIRHAESKVGVVLALGSIAAGILYNMVKNQSDAGMILSVVAVICAVCIAGIAGCAAIALIPRKKPQRSAEEVTNPLFFGDIASKYYGDGLSYEAVLHALTGNATELTKHIAHQIHANAIVAHAKFTWTNRAIYALFGALATLAVVAVIVGAKGA